MSDDVLIAPAVAVVGGGPAGLMAAETLAGKGVRVDLFDAMPSVGRKFLLAGKGGLNLTHSEPFADFVARYGARRGSVEPWLRTFGPEELRAWAQGLGVPTFVGSSGRIFPHDMKAAPLLRAWMHRLRSLGVRFHMRHRCVGLEREGHVVTRLRMRTPGGDKDVLARAVVLALGGASWPQLGSDGRWVEWLAREGVDIAKPEPANCGFDVQRTRTDDGVLSGWSEHFRSRFEGFPVKTVTMYGDLPLGASFRQRGEFVITASGVEGGLIYAVSSMLREQIKTHGRALVHIDLLPDRSDDWVRAEVARPRGSRSLSTHLKSRLHIEGLKAALLHELLPRESIHDAAALARAIKALPLEFGSARPVAEAISTAGGVRFGSVDERLMLHSVPGVFCAGEMLDWEAPTGGYLITACMAGGAAAGRGVLELLQPPRETPN
jgi:uncharacterized flavoprotein (TIGR03862 family)